MSVRSSTVAVRRIDAYRPSRPERDVLIAGHAGFAAGRGVLLWLRCLHGLMGS